jgi:hypothetical protein
VAASPTELLAVAVAAESEVGRTGANASSAARVFDLNIPIVPEFVWRPCAKGKMTWEDAGRCRAPSSSRSPASSRRESNSPTLPRRTPSCGRSSRAATLSTPPASTRGSAPPGVEQILAPPPRLQGSLGLHIARHGNTAETRGEGSRSRPATAVTARSQ